MLGVVGLVFEYFWFLDFYKDVFWLVLVTFEKFIVIFRLTFDRVG